ncbi:MAG: DUF448 domain-containing protein [Anaerolineales bacterium]|nr:DUF448 domain-containing protein [Anaerolineales bacterium]
MASRKRRRRHVPQRTCVGCRQVLSKRSLIRIVRGPDGVKIDLNGKAPGRGAYLHDQRTCWQEGLRGSLARALRTDISPEARQELVAFMDRFVDELHG